MYFNAEKTALEQRKDKTLTVAEMSEVTVAIPLNFNLLRILEACFTPFHPYLLFICPGLLSADEEQAFRQMVFVFQSTLAS